MSNIVTLEDSNFDQVVNNLDIPIFIDLWAEWCIPCRKIAPVVAELANEYDGKMKFAKLNVDLNPDTAKRYKVMSIPMFLILQKEEVLESFIGAVPKKKFVEKIESALSKL
ncbi:MAG: thioredoxin [Candidatus Hodarchaeales archaeon]|jgi:thioredoxin 1